MAENKPTAAFAISLVAGIFILINGLWIAAVGTLLAFLLPAIGAAIAAIGLVFGIIVLIAALMMYSKPKQSKAWGAIVLVFSLLSIIIGGGFIIGMILGIVGGALGLAWRPSRETEEEKRTCLNCGRLYPVKYNVCPYCGAAPGEKKEEAKEESE
ncbi:MAG: hypothetical protein FE048_05785 [Thermoplasmata archaeon]|nr:MAG: hypothetical protein FE048_05785 [Thermoplasmata archaeon]